MQRPDDDPHLAASQLEGVEFSSFITTSQLAPLGLAGSSTATSGDSPPSPLLPFSRGVSSSSASLVFLVVTA
eukprot:15927256-Heterocapsa_arctica.AAC.1